MTGTLRIGDLAMPVAAEFDITMASSNSLPELKNVKLPASVVEFSWVSQTISFASVPAPPPDIRTADELHQVLRSDGQAPRSLRRRKRVRRLWRALDGDRRSALRVAFALGGCGAVATMLLGWPECYAPSDAERRRDRRELAGR